MPDHILTTASVRDTVDAGKRERCENCRWAHINWRAGDEYEHCRGYGDAPTIQKRVATSVQCRRHAPRKAAAENDSDGWPWIGGDDWCGEFTPTKQEEPR